MANLAASQNDFDVKIKAEREMEMSTDLLAEAGVEEPKVFGRRRSIKTGILLIIYLSLCTIINLVTMAAVNGKMRAFYGIKSMFTLFGAYAVHKKISRMNLLFTSLFGISILVESIPCFAGILVLFSNDICSVLAGLSSEIGESEDFVKFCRDNIEGIRLGGTFMIVSEVLLDTLMFIQMVKYQKYLQAVQRERINLNYYTGKAKIALP